MTKKYCLFLSWVHYEFHNFLLKLLLVITNRIKINLKIQYIYIYRQKINKMLNLKLT